MGFLPPPRPMRRPQPREIVQVIEDLERQQTVFLWSDGELERVEHAICALSLGAFQPFGRIGSSNVAVMAELWRREQQRMAASLGKTWEPPPAPSREKADGGVLGELAAICRGARDQAAYIVRSTLEVLGPWIPTESRGPG
jgi:hypothetical protein